MARYTFNPKDIVWHESEWRALLQDPQVVSEMGSIVRSAAGEANGSVASTRDEDTRSRDFESHVRATGLTTIATVVAVTQNARSAALERAVLVNAMNSQARS